PNTKSGYVKYEGSAATRVDIPRPSITNAQKIVYGTSGRGRELAAYKVGNGSNSLVFVCEIHGWEDNWPADGIELTKIGNGLIEHFQNAGTNNWSLYIIPAANPDGVSEGFTNNGPGRCTIVGAVDCNRDFPLGFSKGGVPRYHSGNEPLSVPESRGLRDFIQGIKNRTSGEMCVIDLHGWEGAAIGNPEIGQYFRNQFGFEQRYGYGDDRGFMIGWAKSIGAKAALIELPGSTKSHSDVVNGRYLQKITSAVTNLIGGSGGSSSGGSTGGGTGLGGSSAPDITYITHGEVIDVQSFLNVRKGPGTSYDSGGQLHQGDKVNIVAKNGDWYKISSPIVGYVHKNFINIKKAVGKTYTDALEIIRGILREMGFRGTLDINAPIASIMVGNLKVSAYIGTSSTIGIGEGKIANFNVTNGKIDFTVSGFPMAEFLKIQRKLEEIAIKIEDGNITASINSKGELTMEFAIKLKNSETSITDKLYCKITCSTERDLDNKGVYDEAYTTFSLGNKKTYAIVTAVFCAIGAVIILQPELAVPALLVGIKMAEEVA
ncbi:SH3 domain-containing protein, partial [Clostridium perfringens]|uniref:SH3 domain-containing protein n=1 Tax=Clostridium perfringens TaxID=1502 RepID=UPI0039E89247